MRIVCVSDLHLDHEGNEPVMEAMLEVLGRGPPDVLVVAGDLASGQEGVARGLERLRRAAPRVVYVPGNHDLWSPWRSVAQGEVDTWTIYREVLPALAQEAGVEYLPEGPVCVGDVAFVGVTGWYDYSTATRVARFFFDDAAFRRGYQGGFAWADALRTAFLGQDGEPMSDAEVVAVMVSDLKTHLEAVPEHISRVVAVTHVVPFAQTVQSRPFFAMDFFTAFLGSVRLGEVLLADPRVSVSICGHAHTPLRKRIGPILLVRSPLGYPREWRGSPATVARERLGAIELEDLTESQSTRSTRPRSTSR